MIRQLSDSVGEAVFEKVGRAVSRAQERRPLPVDLLESDDAYLAIFDAAGVSREDVTVTYEEGTISVQIDRFRDFAEGYEMVFPGRGLALDGHVELPEEAMVDPAGATATLKRNGTLHVQIPKVAEKENGESTVEVTTHSDEDGAKDADENGDSEAES